MNRTRINLDIYLEMEESDLNNLVQYVKNYNDYNEMYLDVDGFIDPYIKILGNKDTDCGINIGKPRIKIRKIKTIQDWKTIYKKEKSK